MVEDKGLLGYRIIAKVFDSDGSELWNFEEIPLSFKWYYNTSNLRIGTAVWQENSNPNNYDVAWITGNIL